MTTLTLPTRLRRLAPSDDVREFNHMLGRFFGGSLLREIADSRLGLTAVDIREDTDHMYIEADLPGFQKEEVQVTLEDGILTIAAEHREARDGHSAEGHHADGSYLLHERKQSVVRSFTLPPEVDQQDVHASLENGVLRITFKKRDAAKSKQIPVS